MRPRRRRFPRYSLRSLAYVRLDEGNGGIIRDLTEQGVAVQAVVPLQPTQEVALSFDLLSPRVRVEARGQVHWADSSGQGGIQFWGLSPRLRRTLRDWILTQMLSAAAVAGRDSIFAPLEPELVFSSPGRPAIVLNQQPESPDPARIQWGWFSCSRRRFSILIDALVLVCAVLLFWVTALAAMGGMPPWPLGTALFLATSVIFAAVYQFIFSDFLYHATPGQRLALLAAGTAREDSVTRFR
ncbi:MAG TPA: PilZ domain-containing protein [Terriglobales bacterium]|nr:PilZ domain-containing protein [Terriglobales bacterium]